MSFVSTLPANTVKFSYTLLAKTILASDSGLGTDYVSVREFVLIDYSKGDELIDYLDRLIIDSGAGTEIAKLIVQVLDYGSGYEQAVAKVISIIHNIVKARDYAEGIDVRNRREACITVFGVNLCKILPGDIIKPEDHNNVVNILKVLRDKIEEVRNILESLGG